jgi:hypothetical protein
LLLVFAYSLWDFNLVRLTAVSAGNDFAAALYAMAAVYFYIESSPQPIHRWTVILFAFFAVTLKLSLAPLLLLSLPAVINLVRQRVNFIMVPLLASFLLLPMITRNLVISGYPLYPSTSLGWNQLEWKVSEQTVINEKLYIKAWARTPGVQHEQVKQALAKDYTTWIPLWWKAKPMAQKLLTVLFAISLIMSVVNLRIFFQRHRFYLIVVLLSGIIFCGFIIPFIAVTFLPYSEKWNHNNFSKVIEKAIITGMIIVLLVYSFYRGLNFFNNRQLLVPLGIETNPALTINCNNFKFTIPFEGYCRDFKVPCLYGDCNKIIPRGKTIQEGFLPPVAK